MQLLTIAIPKLEEMQKEGEDGRKKIAAITRYVTVALALIESIAMAIGFGRQGLLEEYNFRKCAIVVCTLTAGSAFLMWIGERITEKGVGNGISIVLLINILSRVPNDFVTLYTQFMKGKTCKGCYGGIHYPCEFCWQLCYLLSFCRMVREGLQYSIPRKYREEEHMAAVYTYSVESKYCRSNSGYLCIFTDADPDRNCPVPWKGRRKRMGSQILAAMNSNNWCDPDNRVYSVGLIIYISLTIFFAYFYTSITFNPWRLQII